MTPKDGPPPARSGQATFLDSTNQRMTIFGGADASGVLNDTWVLSVPGLSGMSCTPTVFPNIIRGEGIAELMGDVVLNCTGGTPTPLGKSIPEYTLTYSLNTNVTSRRLPEAPDLSEALLMIDEPFPLSPIPTNEFASSDNPLSDPLRTPRIALYRNRHRRHAGPL